ncbi:carbohydrate sulfotransferase 11-like [Haliotis rufescens]|uniref:carbohydrate sulfotransferase 11-like n=1 Tax=Haliotis rufescens TaxID=6454 RepID=UPI00201F890F|nr:carbohydrate sulfotransferase 11-like [Haliotis rufescens]
MKARLMGRVKSALIVVGVVSVLLPTSLILTSNIRADTSSDTIQRVFVEATRLKKLLSVAEADSRQHDNRRAVRYRNRQEFCAAKGNTVITPEMFKHIIVNDKYKILYCQVPKVACTNWRRVMLILTGKMNTSEPMELKASAVHGAYDDYLTYLSDLPINDIKYRLKNYYKFVFTREPFERILSAYRNKFKGNNPFFHKRYGKNIVRRYRVNSWNTKPDGKDVSFNEYVHYLTDYTRREPLNEHWEKMTELCHPCLIKYDLVSSYDDLETDSVRLLDKIGASRILQFPKRSASYKHAGTEELLRQYYSQIPPVMLDQLMEVYYPDFLMFRYKVPNSLRNLTHWQVKL